MARRKATVQHSNGKIPLAFSHRHRPASLTQVNLGHSLWLGSQYIQTPINQVASVT
jgi:hypothetical protein